MRTRSLGAARTAALLAACASAGCATGGGAGAPAPEPPVIAEPVPVPRPPPPRPRDAPFEVVAYQLRPWMDELTGYGAYSYVLISHPAATPDECRRQLAVLRGFLDGTTPLEDAILAIANSRLNLMAVPVESFVPDPGARGLLAVYHYRRAREILGNAGLPRGIWLVSAARPLATQPYGGRLGKFELTATNPELIHAFARAFFEQAAQPEFWRPDGLARLKLALRDVVVNAGDAAAALKPQITDFWATPAYAAAAADVGPDADGLPPACAGL